MGRLLTVGQIVIRTGLRNRSRALAHNGDHMIDNDDLERADVWLGKRHLEALEYMKEKYGATASGAVRAGLELMARAF